MKLIQPHYRILLPKNTNGFSDQWASCYKDLMDILKKGILQPFRLNVFIDSDNSTDYTIKANLIRQSFSAFPGGSCPSFTILPQAPEYPYHVLLEAGFISSSEAEVGYNEINKHIVSHIKADQYNEYWLSGEAPSQYPSSFASSSEVVFDNLVSQLRQMGMGMNDIVRQWNYIGKILDCNKMNGLVKQNYQLFNEARYNSYKEHRTVSGFPAATGIGTAIPGISIDCLVIPDHPDINIIPVNNPNQINSYQYDQKVLIGSPDTANVKKHPPQFERALLITTGESSRLLISGTAAIKGQFTVAKEDLHEQTLVTIENIHRLCSTENLLNHCPKLTCIPDKFSYLRVYVAHRDQIPIVKSIIGQYYGDVPINYVQADICRNDLLVEIEAEMVS